MRFCDLKQKEVININTCCALGCVVDLDFDPCNGFILALIVPGPGKIRLWGRDSEYIIPFDRVTQIGADIVLVDIDEEKCLVKCI